MYLARRWKRQPQGPVEVDWGHPMARGLVCFGDLRSPSESFDAARRGRIDGAGLSSVTRSVGSIGAASSFPGNTESYYTLQTSTSPASYTLGAVVQSFADGAVQNVIDDDDAVTRVHQFRQNGSNQVELITFQGSNPYFLTLAWPNRRRGSAIAASATGTVTVIAADGVSASGTSGSINALSSTNLVGKSRQLSMQRWNGLIALAAVWNRAFSEPELRDWTLNPWQVLRPRRLIIYSLPASGIPVLSGSTVIDIGQTSARPRVTVTF